MDTTAIPLPGPLRAPPPFPFVGRTTELARLEWLWAGVDAGHRVALVSGEAGAGKSRLVAELAHRVAGRGGLVLYGACDPTSELSYQPVTEALSDLFRHAGAELSAGDLGFAANELTRLFPDLRVRFPGLDTPTVRSAPETERHLLHTALVDVLVTSSARRPLLLILDDLHWADHATLLFLRHLLRTRTDARLMIVAVFRDSGDDVGEALADTLGELARVPDVLRLALPGLGSEEISNFVEWAGGMTTDGTGRDVVTALEELTRGNPFLLGELWNHLVETGVLARDGDGWRLVGTVTDIGSPAGVRQVVRQRLARLSPATRVLLETAAVSGPEVDLALLRGAVDLDEDAFLGAVEEVVHSGTLTPGAGARPVYRFAHELVRRAVYDRLNPVAAARLHLRVAEALERSPDEDPRVLVSLAAHYTEAAPLGVGDRAVAQCLRAADAAVDRLAFDQAADLLHTALELGVPVEERCRVRLALGAAQRAASRWRQAVESYREAARHARLADDTGSLAEAALGLEETCWRPGITTAGATELLTEAIGALAPGQERLRVRLLAALARAYGYAGDWPHAASARRKAVALARTLDDPATLARALAQSYWGRGTDDARDVLSALDEALTLARSVGDPDLICGVSCWRVPLLAEMGRFDEVRSSVADFRAIAEPLGQNVYLHQCAQVESAIALADGRLEEAETRAERALELSRDERYDARGVHGIQMFSIRREQGRLAELEPVVRLVRTRGADLGVWGPGLAVLYAELGMRDEARTEIARLCADGFAAIPDDALRTAALTYLADACVAAGDAEHAASVYAELAPFSGTVVVVAGLVAYYGATDRFLGSLAACRGEWGRAERHFAAATDLDARLRTPTWLARSRYEYARMLRARGAAEDSTRARELVVQARHAAAHHGLTGLLRRIDALTSGSAEPEPPDGLTGRELDVLRLLAAGRSNRDIARNLFISQNTAANHVRSILAKTGCANRTEAAAFAHRHGLTGER